MTEFNRSLAVIIGINNYTNGIHPLKTAKADAEELARILEQNYHYNKVILITDDTEVKPTRENLLKLLRNTLLEEKLTQGDRLLFYFAGHGIARPGEEEGEEGPQGFLVPSDAHYDKPDSLISMRDIYEYLAKLDCRHLLVILDCCFAGAFRWASSRKFTYITKKVTKAHYQRFTKFPAWEVITSSGYNQEALDFVDNRGQDENDEKHSPFAEGLFKALIGKADLNNDGVIVAPELYIYIRDYVEKSSLQRQTPGFFPLQKHDRGEYIFRIPGKELNLAPAPELNLENNPYRGLKSFDEKHSELFFGRTELIEKLQNFVRNHTLTVVLGASGSGKSSLVKAGLIPKLRKDKNDKWCILPPIRPNQIPLTRLNNVLKNAELPEVVVQKPQQNLAHSIDVWAKRNPNSKLLLFIDQSEEIITLCKDEDERKEFFQQILEAINAHRDKLHVVISLRSDFEPQVRDAGLKFVPTDYNVGKPVLKNRWQSGRFIVPAMTRGQLREAIEKPAEERVMYFQPNELVEQLIDEVADMPGALPLLSFTLKELYFKYLERQRDANILGIIIDRALIEEDYQELGGVIQSLTRRADEEYKTLVKKEPAYAQIICHVMLRMVALGGTQLARRRVSSSELEYLSPKNDFAKEVIKRFTKVRLLVEGQDDDGNPYVEPAHDALVQGWQKLLMWREENNESLPLQRLLTPAAQEWERLQQAKFLWNANPRLDLLKKVSKSDDNWLNKVEAKFVRRSIQKRRNNRYRLIGSVTFAFLLLVGFSINLWHQAQDNELRALSASGQALFASDKQLDGLVKALKAGKKLKQGFLVADDTREQVMSTLVETVYFITERNRSQKQFRSIRSVRFSPDDKIVASGNDDGYITFWNMKDKPREVKHGRGVSSISFSPNGKMLASAGNGGKIKLWKLLDRKPIDKPIDMRVVSKGKKVNSVSFSPNGKMLVSGDSIGNIKIWDIEKGKIKDKKPKTFPQQHKNVNVVKFSPDGKRIVSSGNDGKINLWNLNGELQKSLSGHTDRVLDVSFSRDGEMLASASSDQTIKLWNVEDGQLRETLIGHQNAVNSISFSHDSKILASASSDSNIKLWSVKNSNKNKEIATYAGHGHDVSSIRFSHKGKNLISGSADKTVRLWSLEDENVKQLLGHNGDVFSLSYIPNSKILASGSADNTIKLWDTEEGKEKESLTHGKRVIDIQINPDGKILASVSEGKTIKLWSIPEVKLIDTLNTLEKHPSSVYTISFSPNGERLASAGAGKPINFWSIPNGKFINQINKGGYIARFSPNGKIVAATGDSGKIILWHQKENSNDYKRIELPTKHSQSVYNVSFSPDSKMLASASADGTIELWNLTNYEKIETFNDKDKGHTDEVRNITFSPDGEILASASNDYTIKLWSVKKRKLLITLQGHKATVYALGFSGDNGKTLASGGKDGIILLWNMEGLKLDNLLSSGCAWVRDYLRNNPNVVESDRHLCENVPTATANHNK